MPRLVTGRTALLSTAFWEWTRMPLPASLPGRSVLLHFSHIEGQEGVQNAQAHQRKQGSCQKIVATRNGLAHS